MRETGDVPAAVSTDRVGQGLPHAVGQPQNPAGLKVHADRWEVRVELPGELDEQRMVDLRRQLRESADADPSLGGRVSGSRLAPGDEPLSREDSREYGEDAWKITFPITTYRTEKSPQASGP
ncbi:MAG TPA: hypothetical protein VJT75_07450 [Thermoleophilaceae bacterium]|nr:hypothetical protein [Thermoleophilaceae bacterium]